MKKYLSKLRKINYRHYIAIAITLAFACCTIFIFPSAFVRIGESFRDIWNSLLYYIQELFFVDLDAVPSVIGKSDVPFTPFFDLPATWEEFTIQWDSYWQVWATGSNFTAYLTFISDLLYNLSRFLLLIGMPLILMLYLMFQRYLSKENNDYNKNSKPLTFVLWLADKIYIPVKKWLFTFVDFLKEYVIYTRLWLVIWLFNFNIITIVLEFIAFYLYFVVSFDFGGIYTQLYKLFCDISVPLAFIPPFAWLFIAYWFICWLRKRIGYKNLARYESRNCAFTNERPIVMMLTGTMGKKKTTIATDISLSEETILREKAFELILKNDMKFPNFPWINLENNIQNAFSKHKIYNLATIEMYIRKKQARWEKKKTRANIYDYDFERYGLTHNDALQVVNVWRIIETYAKLYFVYIIESSLIVSNYSIRTDNLLDSVGNFPLWDMDFFKRDATMIDAYSRHAHILDFDSLRPIRQIIEDNPKKDSFEFGIINITEIGKERKNNLTLQEMKVKDAFANQKNDGFAYTLKMIRHSATIDNYPFIKIISDEQRAESLGADARDLLEIVNIDETFETRLAMPFFSFTDLLHDWLYKKFESMYYQYRYKRSDNTLFMYTFKKLMSTFHHYHERIYNTFGYSYAQVQVEKGTQDGKVTEKKYYIMSKKIYSRRFSTDCFRGFYTKKALRSEIGLNDLEEYQTEKATFEELDKQNSYFINELTTKHFNDKKDSDA